MFQRLHHAGSGFAALGSRRVRRTAWSLLVSATIAFAGSARADDLFSFTQGPNPTLLSINTATGTATPVAALNAQLTSLTTAGSVLYGGTVDGNLLRIDASTGASTLLGSTGAADPLFGLAFFGGNLYGLQGPLGGIENLLLINTTTAATSLVGQVQATATGEYLSARGLTIFNGQLTTADAGLGAGGDLFALNPLNGQATNLTATGVGIGINGLRSLDVVNGTLYAVNNDPTDPNHLGALGLYTVDPSTARTDFVARVNIIPEPSTLALLAFAGLALLPLRRRAFSF